MKAWGRELRPLESEGERLFTYDAEDAEDDHTMSRKKDAQLVVMAPPKL